MFTKQVAGLGSCCSHLNFDMPCFKWEIPWNSDNYRVQTHSKLVCDMVTTKELGPEKSLELCLFIICLLDWNFHKSIRISKLSVLYPFNPFVARPPEIFLLEEQVFNRVFYFMKKKPLKNYEKCFYHLKYCFHYQDKQIFVIFFFLGQQLSFSSTA